MYLRAFSVHNILCRDVDRTHVRHPLLYQDSIEDLGTEFDIQKNRRNGQVAYFRRENKYPDYCPILLGLHLLWHAQTLGQRHDDPLYV